MSRRFYSAITIPENSEFAVPDKVAHHMLRVLRMTVGDTLELFDGRGGTLSAEIIQCTPALLVTTTTRSRPLQSPILALRLCPALLGNEKMDWVVQKAVELGVTHISPFVAERSGFRLSHDQAEKKHRHWQDVIISACEQSGGDTLPALDPLQSLATLIKTTAGNNLLFGDPLAGRTLAEYQAQNDTLAFVIGPEGGLSEEEMQVLDNAGAHRFRLGTRVLRTETAAVAMLAAAQTLWGDFCR